MATVLKNKVNRLVLDRLTKELDGNKNNKPEKSVKEIIKKRKKRLKDVVALVTYGNERSIELLIS